MRAVLELLAVAIWAFAAALAGGHSVTLQTASGPVELAPTEVELSQQTTGGWGMASEGGLTVALDLKITPELAKEGLARELVRLIQDARKAAGLDVVDRIELTVEASGSVRDAVAAHRDWIAGEVLATDLEVGNATAESGHHEERELDGHRVAVTIRKT
jgi:isoleucyl-tRNA synthetase